MENRLKPFGTDASSVSKVGKSKSPLSLGARMPSHELLAKVGQASVGDGMRDLRVIRRNAG